MDILKKSAVIGAYIGLLSWILIIAFKTTSLNNESVLLNYAIIAVFALILFKLNKEHSGNA
ncbi:MAG: hypothetical protein CME64_00720 [Halobacteriovoraceae bacterium]|nr:hypothetical protein [Halobacteriovoraceae bacterium]